MLKLTTGEKIAIGSLLLAGVVWAVRLEGRINGHEKDIQSIQEVHREAVKQFRDDLAYIRTRIDQALER